MPQITIDDDSVKRKRLKHKKDEEKKNSQTLDMTKEPVKEDSKSAKRSARRKKEQEIDNSPDAAEKAIERKRLKKKRIKMAILAAVLLLIFAFRGQILGFLEDSKSDTEMAENELVMIDLTGYDEQSAIDMLTKVNITPQIVYIYDKYSANGTVIKTSVEAGDVVQMGSTIKLYICDDGDPYKEADYSLVETPDTPFYKNNLDIIGFDIVDDMFAITIQNNHNVCITAIEYSIEYTDEFGNGLGDKTFKETGLTILPGDKYILQQKINNADVRKLSIEKISCTTTSVPEEQRTQPNE